MGRWSAQCRTSFPGFPKPIQALPLPGCSKGYPHPPPACWPNSAGLGWKWWGGGMGGTGQATIYPQSCTMVHLGP